MSESRQRFSHLLKNILDRYYPGWDGNREILQTDQETWRSLKETWIQQGTPQTSARFKDFLKQLDRIPTVEKNKLIELEAQARLKHRGLNKNSNRMSDEREHKGIHWIQKIPPSLTESQKEVVNAGIELFNYLVVDELGSLDIRNSSVWERFGDNTYDTFKAAVRSGSLRLLEVPRDLEREKALRRCFPNLRQVYVAQVSPSIGGTLVRTELVAFLAASRVMPNLRVNVAGVGGGYTLLRLSEQSIPSEYQFGRTTWISLNNFRNSVLDAHSPRHIVTQLAHRYSSEPKLLPWMGLSEATSDDTREQYAEILSTFDRATVALISVNAAERRDRGRSLAPSVEAEGFQWRSADFQKISDFYPAIKIIREKGLYNKIAGEFIGYVLDDDGNNFGQDVEHAIDSIATRIPLQKIKEVAARGEVYAIAARAYKARPLLMAIRFGIVNALVIDTEIAINLESAVKQDFESKIDL